MAGAEGGDASCPAIGAVRQCGAVMHSGAGWGKVGRGEAVWASVRQCGAVRRCGLVGPNVTGVEAVWLVWVVVKEESPFQVWHAFNVDTVGWGDQDAKCAWLLNAAHCGSASLPT